MLRAPRIEVIGLDFDKENQAIISSRVGDLVAYLPGKKVSLACPSAMQAVVHSIGQTHIQGTSASSPTSRMRGNPRV